MLTSNINPIAFHLQLQSWWQGHCCLYASSPKAVSGSP